MDELKLNKKEQVTLDDLKVLKPLIYSNISSNATTKKYNFELLIQYNEDLLKNKLDAETVKIEIANLKEQIKNKTALTDVLTTIKTDQIFEVTLNSNYVFFIERKLFLKDIYEKFNEYCDELSINSQSIAYIKIYDFYQNTEDFTSIFDNINQKTGKYKKVKQFFSVASSKKGNLDPSKIKILTGINSKLSFELYEKIYAYRTSNYPNNRVDIKYMPESTSKNIYIPSLFYLIVKYSDKNKNYKYLISYLESNTNWGVVLNTRPTSKTFSNQFFNLLNIRFDEQYNSASILFRPEKVDENDFYLDVDNIMEKLKNNFQNQQIKTLDKNILTDIHTLKSKYKTTNYAYKLLKSFYYFSSYLNIIRNKISNKNIPNTSYVIESILSNSFESTIHKLLLEMGSSDSEFKDIDIYELRLLMIVKIDEKKALCDIFPNMNWTEKIHIIKNLKTILSNENYLKIFYQELGVKHMVSTKHMQECFEKNVLNQIKKGETIKGGLN